MKSQSATSSRPQFDPAAVNAKPRALKLARCFVFAFLALLFIDFVSIFTVWTIVFPSWQFTLNGGSVAFQDSDPISYPYRSAVNFTFWFPIWDPTSFYFSSGKGSAGTFALAFPIWILSLPCAIAALIAFHRAVRRADLCANCNYDIHSQPTNTCPECGKPVNPGVAQLPLSQTLRGFSSVHKTVIRLTLLLAAIGALLVGGMFALVWSMQRYVTIIVPTDYVGEILFVEDPTGMKPEGSFRTFTYRVPDSGIARVTDVDLVYHVSGAPGGRVHIRCFERDGTELPWGPKAERWFTLEGPLAGITQMSIRRGSDFPSPHLWVPPDLMHQFRNQGVPTDFVAPHEIQPRN